MGFSLTDILNGVKADIMGFLATTLQNSIIISLDLVCTGLVIYATVCAFKMITTSAHSEPRFSLLEKSTYLSAVYFIARLLTLIVPFCFT